MPLDAVPSSTSSLAAHLLQALSVDTLDDFLRQALQQTQSALNASSALLARGRRGKWKLLGSAGSDPEAPVELLAETLDRETVVRQADWLAAPLPQSPGDGEVLAVRSPETPQTLAQEAAQWLGEALLEIRLRLRKQQRIERLEAILEIAAQWRQARQTDDLLHQIAEASTKLLGAERASIFLWHKPSKTLVGRPALGVENGELRIAEDQGVVGQVVQSGLPGRVDRDVEHEQQQIDRSVDQKLAFQTHNLICVPLETSEGRRLGAFEVLNKHQGDFTDEDEAALIELASHAAVALENTQQYERLLTVRRRMADEAAEKVQMIGESAAIQTLRDTVSRIADTELSILILGENGCGKEVVSRMVHYLSQRRDNPLVAVNCAALTETLLESELFGHEKGAFTDAQDTRAGKFELAHQGTLFLDEIGDMSLGGQAKLLRVLEEKILVRVGGSTPIHADVRVVAATNRNLAERVRDKLFREDLYYRIGGVTLELPPLRQRGHDILLLAENFLQQFCGQAKREAPQFTDAARKRLLLHTWPGNVRELRNLMERLAYLSQGEQIDADELNFILSPRAADAERAAAPIVNMDLPLAEATRDFQVEYIQKHIDSARGNMTEAARNLGLHRSNLYRKMRQLGMDAEEQ